MPIQFGTISADPAVLLRALGQKCAAFARDTGEHAGRDCAHARHTCAVRDYSGHERRGESIRQRLDIAEIHDAVTCGMATHYEGAFALYGLDVPFDIARRVLGGAQ